jgi:hypothetical protein
MVSQATPEDKWSRRAPRAHKARFIARYLAAFGMTSYSSKDIEGSWRLRSWRIRYADGGAPTDPFGEQPDGLLVYSPDGWMSAAVCRRDRPLLPPDQSPRTADAEQVAGMFRSYFHYAGPFRVEGDRVVHSVRLSLNPNFVGTEQIRHMHLDGSMLTLRGEDSVDGRKRRHELVWQRAAEQRWESET